MNDVKALATYEKTVESFGSLNPNNLDEYFFCKFELDEAERSGCLPQKLAALGLSGKTEWGQLEAAYYTRHFGHFDEAEAQRRYASAAEAARERFDRLRWHAAASRAPALLAPAEDVTVEAWARISAALSRCRNNDARALGVLRSHGIDRDKFERVDEEFRARMRVDSHGIIAGVYSRAFSSAPGVPSRSSRFTAPRPIAGMDDDVAPCTFDRYVEVTSAHEAWGDSGRDVASLLSNMFGLSLSEFSQIVRYWATRCSIDSALASKYAYDKAQSKQKYIGGGYVTMT